MTRDRKRLAAALAAVAEYVGQEQGQIAVAVPHPVTPSAWALAGRLEQISVRAAMQARGRR